MDRRDRRHLFRRAAAVLVSEDEAALRRRVERATTADGQVVTSQLNAPIPANLTSVVDAVSVRTTADGVSTKTDLAGHIADFASAIVARFISPMTTRGDLIRRGASAAERLALGTSGHVLTSNGTDPVWSAPTTGMTNPMTTRGDIIRRGAAAPERLAVGTSGQVLTSDGTDPAWATPAASLSNPMTTAADLIVGDTAGAPARLGKGANGQVLTVDPTSGLLVWATPASGMSDPTTTKGDLIARGASAVGRLGVGADGQVLTADAAEALGIKWAVASGGGGAASSQETFGLKTGRWVTPRELRDSTSSLTSSGLFGAANRLQLQPYYWPGGRAISQLGLWVGTAGAAGAVVRVGIYSLDTNGDTVSLLSDVGSFAADSTGVKTITGLSISPAAGWIGIGFLSNDNAVRIWYYTQSGPRSFYGQSVASGGGAIFGVYDDIASGWSGMPASVAIDGYQTSYLYHWAALV